MAKEAADVVLVDDNFSSMVLAVEEGRLMFDNIKKLMVYVLTHAFPELWALFIYYCFGMPIGTTALMVLFFYKIFQCLRCFVLVSLLYVF